MVRYEELIKPRKSQLLDGICGRVLEIGPGNGSNLVYCQHAGKWIGVEPNRFLHPRLRKELAKTHVTGEIIGQPAELIDLPDCSFDVVIVTLVLCSVTRPRTVLEQVLRLLKPGGRYFFIEHVLEPRKKSVQRFQRAIRPLWRLCGGGCRPDRDTLAEIISTGFEEVQVERFHMPRQAVPWFLSSHIAGCATKSATVNVDVAGSTEHAAIAASTQA